MKQDVERSLPLLQDANGVAAILSGVTKTQWCAAVALLIAIDVPLPKLRSCGVFSATVNGMPQHHSVAISVQGLARLPALQASDSRCAALCQEAMLDQCTISESGKVDSCLEWHTQHQVWQP